MHGDFHIDICIVDIKLSHRPFSIMSTATKVKLPSILELTKQPLDINSRPQLESRLPSQETPYFPLLYSYHLYRPQPPPMYQTVYYPVDQPLVSPVYSVPEVVNKPMNKCHRCDTTETPEWRRGPNGLRTLCNACGLYHAKLVKRKGAVLAAEEVLNNKVCKGKNGRRISVKKQRIDELRKRMAQVQVTEIPPIPFPGKSYRMLPSLNALPDGRVALPMPVMDRKW